MIRVLIESDNDIVRKGLASIVGEAKDMEVSGEVETYSQTIRAIEKQAFDVVILCPTSRGKSAVDTVKTIKEIKPDLQIIIFSADSDINKAIRMIKAGADGYLTIETSSERFVEGVRKVCDGGKQLATVLLKKLVFDQDGEREKKPHEALSDREFEVFRMIAEGHKVNDIAAELCLSNKTISTYRTRLMQKLEMESNTELVKYAIKNAIIGEL